ncbi:MAG: hypothetical protein H7836_15070 [Magnetococcus sp. YQC-3]
MYDIPFPSWRTCDCPEEAMGWHNRRASGMLTFIHFALRPWDENAFKLAKVNADPPTFEMGHAEVSGLIEVLASIGESFNLAMNAARAVEERNKQAILDAARANKR